jgi:hypothetical protein
MKCIKRISEPNKDTITRVNDEMAHRAVKSGQYEYVSKSEWKLYRNKQTARILKTMRQSK